MGNRLTLFMESFFWFFWGDVVGVLTLFVVAVVLVNLLFLLLFLIAFDDAAFGDSVYYWSAWVPLNHY